MNSKLFNKIWGNLLELGLSLLILNTTNMGVFGDGQCIVFSTLTYRTIKPIIYVGQCVTIM